MAKTTSPKKRTVTRKSSTSTNNKKGIKTMGIKIQTDVTKLADAKKDKTKKNPDNNLFTKAPDFIKDFKMTENMVVGAREAKIWVYGGSAAVEGIKAQPAIPKKTDKDGKVIQKARLAVAARPAVPALSKVFIIGNTHEILIELIARMADQGFYPDNDGEPLMIDDVRFCCHYTTDRPGDFRSAFKNCKNATGYNKAGLAVLAEKKREEDKKRISKEEAKAKAEKEAKAKAEKGAKAKAKAKDKSEEEGSDWPED